MSNTTTTNTVNPCIQEAERIISEACTFFGLTVKPENIVVTIQTQGKKKSIGWFHAKQWSAPKNGLDLVHEINMSAEHLSTHNMGELILHELAHAENHALNVKDCAYRVHNAKFKAMAEKLGLTVAPYDTHVGYGYTDLGQKAIDFLLNANFDETPFKLAKVSKEPKAKCGTRLIKLECTDCGYVIRTTQKWLDTGLPTCPCGCEFSEA